MPKSSKFPSHQNVIQDDLIKVLENDDFPSATNYLKDHPEFDPNQIIHSDHEYMNGKTIVTYSLWRELSNERTQFLEALLNHPKININQRDAFGRFPLLEAAASGELDVVKLLLEKNADSSLTFNGVTANYYAWGENANEIVSLIPLKSSINAQWWIISKMEALKEIEESVYGDPGGVCKGYTYMSMLNFLDSRRNSEGNLAGIDMFKKRNQRLNAIPSEIFRDHIDALQLKRKNLIDAIHKQGLNQNSPGYSNKLEKELKKRFIEEEWIDLSLLNFLDGIELCQQIDKHEVLHQGYIKRQIPMAIMPLIISDQLEREGGISEGKKFVGVMNLKELEIFFSKLRDTYKNLGFPISMELGCNAHSIAVHYDPLKDSFFYINVNYKCGKVKPIINNQELAQMINNSFTFSKNNEDSLILGTIVYCTKQNQNTLHNSLDKLQKENTFKNLFKVTPEKLSVTSDYGGKLLERSIVEGEMKLVKEILENSPEEKSMEAMILDMTQAKKKENDLMANYFNTGYGYQTGYRDQLEKEVERLEKDKKINFFSSFFSERKESILIRLFKDVLLTSAVHCQQSIDNHNIQKTILIRLREQEVKNIKNMPVFLKLPIFQIIIPDLKTKMESMHVIIKAENKLFSELCVLVSSLQKVSPSALTKEAVVELQEKVTFLRTVINKAWELAAEKVLSEKEEPILQKALAEVISLNPSVYQNIMKNMQGKTARLLIKINPNLEDNADNDDQLFSNQSYIP